MEAPDGGLHTTTTTFWMTAAISRQRSHTMTSSLAGGDDPLTAAMAPPANETPDQRAVRLREEAEAKRVSDAIDEELRDARAREKKRKANEVRVLLLGESTFCACLVARG